MGRVEKTEPIIEHDTFKDTSLEELMMMREQIWNLATTGNPSYHGCFDYGIRPDIYTKRISG